MNTPIVELASSDLVEDGEQANHVPPAARVAYAAIRPLPLPRPPALSLVLPPVIVEVPENEDAASAAKTLELRRRPVAMAHAVQAAALQQDFPASPVEPVPAAYPSVMPATLELPQERAYRARSPRWGAWAVAAALGACGLVGVLAAGVSLYRHEPPRRAAARHVEPARHAPVALTIPAPTPRDGPATGGDDATIDVDALPRAGAPAAIFALPEEKPAAKSTATAANRSAARSAATAANKAAAKSAATTGAATGATVEPAVATGRVRTFASAAGKSIAVDGKDAGSAGPPLAVPCGRHSIAIGDARARSYDVPCGGAITAGQP